jgi:ankyrin repeat protein
MIRLRDRLWFFLLCAMLTALWPAKRLFPRFWYRMFGKMLTGAAYLGSLRALRFLLWLHPDVEARETIGQSTALISAATENQREAALYLLSRGADVNARNAFGVTALMRSAARSDMALTRLLLERGAEVNAQTRMGETAFIEATKAGQINIMQLLLDYGADMQATGPGRMDALIWSAGLGQTASLEFLLEHGISVEGKRGQTALWLALKNQKAQIASLLRQAGAMEPA